MSKKEENAFFDYESSQLAERWRSMKWVKELERKYQVEKLRITPEATQLYWNATKSYVYEQFFASILAISSAMEAFLIRITPSNSFKKDNYFPYYARMAFQYDLISDKIRKELLDFNAYIRNHVVHPKGPLGFEILGFKYKSKGKYSGSWQSPTGEPMHSFTPKQSAEKGINLFLRLVKDYVDNKVKIETEI